MKMTSKKVEFANLYLHHVLAHERNIKVINSNGKEEEPNEAIMRCIEESAGIAESECLSFRKQLVNQFIKSRMDLMHSKLGFVFDYMLKVELQLVRSWLERYPISVLK